MPTHLITGQKDENGPLPARLLLPNILDDPVDQVGVERLRPPVLALTDDLLGDDLDLCLVVVDLGLLLHEELFQGRDDLLLEPSVLRQAVLENSCVSRSWKKVG